MEVDLVTGAHLSGNRVVHRELVIVLQGPCGASVSGGACGACFSHVCGEWSVVVRISPALQCSQPARVLEYTQPASAVTAAPVPVVKYIACAPMPVVVVETVPAVQSAQRQW